MPVISEDPPRLIIPPPIHPDGGGWSRDGSSFPVSKGQLGLWLFLTGILMFFGGLSSAYVVLRGAPSWQSIAIPSLLWANTIILISSSITLEVARVFIRRNRIDRMKFWLTASAMLGGAFIVGQIITWLRLLSVGVHLPTTLHSSFFYILTGTHGLHLLGGIVALGWVLRKAFAGSLTAFNHEALKLCATYWHFMDGLWVYLFLLLLLA